jgi:hypothetical protein
VLCCSSLVIGCHQMLLISSIPSISVRTCHELACAHMARRAYATVFTAAT